MHRMAEVFYQFDAYILSHATYYRALRYGGVIILFLKREHVHEGLSIKKHPNVFLECMVSALQSYNVVNVSLLSPED